MIAASHDWGDFFVLVGCQKWPTPRSLWAYVFSVPMLNP